MNSNIATVGLVPLTIHSTEVFELRPTLDGAPWQLTAGTGNLILADPNGNLTTIACTILDFAATAAWTVVGPVGNWFLCFDITDSQGIRQVTRPVPFAVVSSPV